MKNEISVLIVEDEPAHSRAIVRALKSVERSFCITVSERLADVREFLHDYNPSIMISDMNLPDGLITDWLEETKDQRDFPVLVMTAHGDEISAVKAMKAGAIDYVLKSEAIFADMPRIVSRVMREWEHISARKQAEEALRQSEELFRLSFENAYIGICFVNIEGRFLKVNKQMCEIFGYSREEFENMTINDVTHPDYKDVSPTFIRKSVSKEIANSEFEKQYIHKQGHIIYGRVSSSLVRDSHGKPLYFISHVRDITERRKIEDQLRQAQKMEAVGQLAGGVAHDFNNLLFVISGYVEMLRYEIPEYAPFYNHTGEILKAVKRAVTLIRQLLLFSRREAMRMKPLNLNTLTNDLLKMIRRLIGEHISLEFKSGSNLKSVNADAGQLEQIIVNLCVNARDAMPDGGKILIETENRMLDDDFCKANSWAKQGQFVCLSISDNGCGIPYEFQDRVFEPFFTTKGVGKGTGLGLAAVYGIVRSHEGLIHLYSEAGIGTTFRIYLPAIDESAASDSDTEHDKKLVSGDNKLILLAEDEESVRNMLKRILTGISYRIITAQNGEEAVRIFNEHSQEIDLAILDVVMPILSGQKVFEYIRSIRPNLPVLFMTGYSRGMLDRDLLSQDKCEMIQKPCNTPELLGKVKELLTKG